MTKVIVLQELGSKRNHKINLPCVVGRSDEADLTFSDQFISQQHALIVERDDRIWIEDLKSSNGVYVNKQKIKERVILKPGDSVRLGQTELMVSKVEEGVSEQTLVLHSLDANAVWTLDHERLKSIYEITAELSENQDLAVLGEKIFSRFKEIFKQDRGYLALFQEDGTLKPLLSESSSKAASLSRSIVKRLFQNGESFLLEDALSETSLKTEESIIALKIRSALCAPLIHHNQIYGLIYLDRTVPGAYSQDDLEFLRTISFILAPLIENARLWSELKGHYTRAVDTLRETEARLIDMERKAAYARLAEAMAHEIRNPLMALGGLVRRIAKSGSEGSDSAGVQPILSLVERVEMVLKEVDAFVKIRSPQKRLERIDRLIQEVIESHGRELRDDAPPPRLSVNTPHLMIPLDHDLFKKAISMLFEEISSSTPQGSQFKMSLQHSGNELEILIGEIDQTGRLCELFDPDLQGKPWGLGLSLNIAHKIISDHGGSLLVDPEGHSALPMLIRIPIRGARPEGEDVS